jgi:hypothetical protein
MYVSRLKQKRWFLWEQGEGENFFVGDFGTKAEIDNYIDAQTEKSHVTSQEAE